MNGFRAQWTIALVLVSTACTGRPVRPGTPANAASSIPSWLSLPTGLSASLRGLGAIDRSTAWVSGTGGSWARTSDGGATWRTGNFPGTPSLDFRDIHAFAGGTACVLATAGRIFLTDGRSWRATFSDDRPGIFLDGLAFWDERDGIAFGDPFEGSFLVLLTSDGGASWRQVPPSRLPPPLPGESAFAGSGTSIAVQGTRAAWFGTGGAAVARVFRSTDRGTTWRAAPTPIRSGTESSGIFGLAFTNDREGIAVGGDHKHPEDSRASAALTTDGGETWGLAPGKGPAGYRSGVACAPGRPPRCIAVGPNGSEVSWDLGRNWLSLGSAGYHTVSSGGGSVWAAGPEGRAARLGETSEGKRP